MRLKEWVQITIVTISGALCIAAVGMVEADSWLLLIPTFTILLINMLILAKYGR